MTFEELARLLEAYFDRALIADIRTQLPLGAPYEIWGWDVGDFSGDGYPDVALSVLIPQERQRRVRVYAFVDQDGFLLSVAQLSLPYLELPLEVGIAIRDTTCYVTHKLRAGSWNIRGYRYWLGSFVLWEERRLESRSSIQTELRLNYRQLERHERQYTPDGRLQTERRSIVIPVYPRQQRPLGIVATDATCATVDYIPRGAYYWKGPQDVALRVRAVYDERFLYLAIWVSDDELIAGRCDTCPADELRFWIARPVSDTLSPPASSRRKSQPTTQTRWEFLSFTLRLGDFAEIPPQLLWHIQPEKSTPQQWQRAKAVVARRPDGYTAKLRLPLEFLLSDPDTLARAPASVRFAIELVDVDNEYRPEETTRVCTSSDFSPESPPTYSELLFLPPGQVYGESFQVLAEAVAEELFRLGF